MNNTNENLYQEEYNSIIVSTAISSGWADNELCENILKTLVFERGRMTKHDINYSTSNVDPWDIPNGGNPTRETKEEKLKQNRTGYTSNQGHQHFLVDHTIGNMTLRPNSIVHEVIYDAQLGKATGVKQNLPQLNSFCLNTSAKTDS